MWNNFGIPGILEILGYLTRNNSCGLRNTFGIPGIPEILGYRARDNNCGIRKKKKFEIIIVESGIISEFWEFWDIEKEVIIVESRIISELFPEFWEFRDINGIRK